MRKVIQYIPVAVILIAIGFRYFSQWCIVVSLSCYNTWVHEVYIIDISPIYFFSLYFLPAALALIFVPRHIFISWLKFATIALPLAFIYIATTPVNSNAFIDFYPFYRDDAARVAGGIVTTISLILIFWKYSIAQKQKKLL